MSFQIRMPTNPANESMVDDPTDDTPVDETVLTDQPEQVAECVTAVESIEAELTTETRRMIALESMIDALEAQTGVMQPFEVKMLTVACENAGIEMPSHPFGYGLEGFTGPRGRAVVNITLESFKDKFKAIVQKVIELFKKLLAKLGELFERMTDQTNQHIAFYKRHANGAQRRRGASPKHVIDDVVAVLSLDGQFAPEKIISNLNHTLAALSGGKFQGELVSYVDEVAKAVKPFLDDPVNWRRYAEGVNKLNPPAPDTFTIAEQGTSVVTYQSLPLTGGLRIQFKSVAGANNHGVRGAKERAQALAQIGSVTVAHAAVHRPSGVSLQHAHLDSLIPKVIEVLEASRAMSIGSKSTVASLQAKTREVEQLGNQELPADAASEISLICGHLVQSLPKATALVSGLAKQAAHATIQLSNVYSHMATNAFH